VNQGHGETKKNILYLNSYHHGYRWSDQILAGIRSVLEESDKNIDLQIEYLDTKKYSCNHIKNSLFTLFREKFRGEHFDLAKTLDLIRTLHPDRKKMIVIGDESTTGKGIRWQIEKTLSTYNYPFQVEFWVRLTLEETQKRVENLGDDTFLYHIGMMPFPYISILMAYIMFYREQQKQVDSHLPARTLFRRMINTQRFI
jgi:5S rRNA maturation endonuclease (ribonuclease M5)